MEAYKMQFLKQEYLMNFEKYMTVKQINSSYEIKCNSKQELDAKQTIGYYLSKNTIQFGLFRYQKTLYFMMNQSFYDIKQMNLVFEYRNIDDQLRIFTVKSNDEMLVEFTYHRTTEIVDNWSTEDDLDMFAWISNIYSEGELDNLFYIDNEKHFADTKITTSKYLKIGIDEPVQPNFINQHQRRLRIIRFRLMKHAIEKIDQFASNWRLVILAVILLYLAYLSI